MSKLIKSLFMTLTLVLLASASKAEPTPDLTNAQWLKLSQTLTPFIDPSKPGRSAKMSAVSKDGQYILNAYQNGQSLTLGKVGGGIIAEKNLNAPAARILFTSAGEPVSVSETGEIFIWNARMDAAPEIITISGFEPLNDAPLVSTYIGLQITADRIAIAGWNEAKGLYDRSNGEKISDLSYSTSGISSLKLSPDGKYLAANDTFQILIYRLSDGAFIGQYDFAQAFSDTGGETVRDFEFSSDSRDIHVTHFDSHWRIMDIKSNDIKDLGSLGNASKFALSPNDLKLGYENYIKSEYNYRIEIRERNRVAIGSPTILTVPENNRFESGKNSFLASEFAFSPDGEKLAAIGRQYPESGTRILVWDIENATAIMDYVLSREANGYEDMFGIKPVFSRDGHYVSVEFPDHAAYVLPASRYSLFKMATENGIFTEQTQN